MLACFHSFALRLENNHTAMFRKQCYELAEAILKIYGHGYDRAFRYLKDAQST